MIITERKNFVNTHLCLNVNNVSIVGTDHLGSAVAHKSRSEGAYIETACSRDLRHVVGIITLAYSSIVTLHCSFHSQQCNPQQEFSCGHNCHVSWQNLLVTLAFLPPNIRMQSYNFIKRRNCLHGILSSDRNPRFSEFLFYYKWKKNFEQNNGCQDSSYVISELSVPFQIFPEPSEWRNLLYLD